MKCQGIRSILIWCFAITGATTQLSCETTSDGDVEEGEPAASTTSADDERDEAPGVLTLGKVRDEDLRQTIHAALKQRIEATQDKKSIELGDEPSFQFVIVKMTKGKDDVSGSKTNDADGLEVEVTGWYKHEEETGPECLSFDTMVPVVRSGNSWQVPDQAAISYSRQDQEDCF